MADIFLSYASEDRVRVRPLVEVLEGQGWAVWWDREIPVGMTWPKMIEQALADTRAMVAVWTEASIESEWVQIEASKGKANGPFFPVSLDDVPPPLAFTLVQSADLVGWDGSETHQGLQSVVRQLKAVLGQGGEPEVTLLAWADLLDDIERGIILGARVQVGPQVVSDNPGAFVEELHTRWLERHPSGSVSTPPALPEHAVYLSYASEDKAAAQSLKEALTAADVPLWYDEEQIPAGDQWEGDLRRRIRSSVLFIPLVSKHVLDSGERFFRREWYEAQELAKVRRPGMPFIVPVSLDDTGPHSDGIPGEWREIQWLNVHEDEESAVASLIEAYRQVLAATYQ